MTQMNDSIYSGTVWHLAAELDLLFWIFSLLGEMTLTILFLLHGGWYGNIHSVDIVDHLQVCLPLLECELPSRVNHPGGEGRGGFWLGYFNVEIRNIKILWFNAHKSVTIFKESYFCVSTARKLIAPLELQEILFLKIDLSRIIYYMYSDKLKTNLISMSKII